MSKKTETRYGVLKVIECSEHYLHLSEGIAVWTQDRKAASVVGDFHAALAMAQSRGGLVVELLAHAGAQDIIQ